MRNILTWVLSALLALAFLGAGVTKLLGMPMMVAQFTTSFGYPLWFMYLTGVLEVLAAIAILVPRFAVYGAALIVCIMIGAVYSQVTHGLAAMLAAPLILLVLAVVVGTLRGWNFGGAAPRPSHG